MRRPRALLLLGVCAGLAVSGSSSGSALASLSGSPSGSAATPASPAVVRHALATIPPRSAVCFPRPPGKPVVTSVTLDKASVDVTKASQTLTFTITAHESEAPVEPITSVQIWLSSEPFQNHYRDAKGTATAPVSGSATNGVWAVKVVIPRYTNPGTWTMGLITVEDAGNGFTQYDPENVVPPEGITPQPWGAGWPRTVQVAATPDIRPPRLTGFSAQPLVVDTRTSTRVIDVKASVADSQSGVAGVLVLVGKPGYIAGLQQAPLKRVSGAARKGTWTGRLTIPKWIGSGVQTWAFTVVSSDAMENTVQLVQADLAKRHLTSTIRVRSNGDKVKPQLKSFSYSHQAVDARAASQSVPVSMTLTDDYSGVHSASVVFVSPGGVRSQGGVLHRVSGNGHRGVWKGTVTIPRCSESGAWRAQVGFRDTAHNVVQLLSPQLALRFGTTLSVKALATVGPTVVGEPKATAHLMTFSFDEPVLFAQPIAQTLWVDGYPEGDMAGTWTCRNGGGHVVVCDADHADVVEVSFAPKHAFRPGYGYGGGQRAGQYVPNGVYDESGNPAAFINVSFNLPK